MVFSTHDLKADRIGVVEPDKSTGIFIAPHQELPSLDAENHIFPVFRVGSESERSALWSAVGEIELNEIGADGGRLVNTPLAHLIVAMAIAPVPGLGRRFREALRRRG